MFELKFTKGSIQDDIQALSKVDLHAGEVNELVSSTVLKYVQIFFWAPDVGSWITRMKGALDIPSQGLLGPNYSLQCLSDIACTSAIVKEIIFCESFTLDDSNIFRSCDLWSGTWILSLAAGVSWMRKWAEHIELSLVDLEPRNLHKSIHTLKTIFPEWSSIIPVYDDVRNPEIFLDIDASKINFWISETMGSTTPSFIINENNQLCFKDQNDIMIYNLWREIDPFPEVLQNLVKNIDNFFPDIENKKAALFPDIVNNLYIADGDNSTIKLLSSKNPEHNYLSHVWEEFRHLSWLSSHNRW